MSGSTRHASAFVACEGAPRDLGRDQASGAAGMLRGLAGGRGALERWRDRLLPAEGALTRWQRDLRRYFPHQHEWLEGAARGAGLPVPALLRASLAALEQERDALLVGIDDGKGVLLLRSGAPDALLRCVRPEGRFTSFELASPTLACPWIGVNQAGLAVAVTGGSQPGPCRAHAALLARDCLERFETVPSALAWCLERPVAPGAALLLADLQGDLVGLELLAAARRVRRPEAGVIVLGGTRGAELAKALSEAAGGAGEPLATLERQLGSSAFGAVSRVDVAARSLRRSADAEALAPLA